MKLEERRRCHIQLYLNVVTVMMVKLLTIISIVIFIISNLLLTIGSEISLSNQYDDDEYYDENVFATRVAGGVDTKPLENLDFARLDVIFQNHHQICGGSLFYGLYVLTSASCVKE